LNREGNQVNDETMKYGLLMETAQTHQSLVDGALQRLRTHTQGLDAIVREEIRRTLLEELQSLANESATAARSLRSMARAANARFALWSIGTVTVCGAVTITMIVAAACWLLPTHGEIAALTAKRDELSRAVAHLEERGGRIDLRRCGDHGRYCIRIDRKAPAFGQQADYLIVAGY
jgi:hypothetical protein